MEKDIEKKSIEEYLRFGDSKGSVDKKFIIPGYQRPYSWDNEDCEKLWNDLLDWKDNNGMGKDYFIGTPIVDIDTDNSNIYNIVDGQQRTTTFILLLKALLLKIEDIMKRPTWGSERMRTELKGKRSRIIETLYSEKHDSVEGDFADDSKKENYSFKLLNSESLSEYKDFRGDLKIILDTKTPEDVDKEIMKDIVPAIEENVGTRKFMKKKQTRFSNYYNNFEFFCKKIDAFGSDELNNFAEFFLDNCSVIMILCKDTDQALSMFHSLNSRGMPLTDSDIIFASLYKNAKSIKKLDEFKEEWKKLKGDDDASDNGNFYEIAEFGLSEDDVYLQQMYRYVAKKSVSDANSSGNVSDKSCRDFFETILNAGADPLEVCKDLVALTEMWKEVFEYTLVKILMKMNSNSRRFLAVYFNRFDSVDELKENKDETNEFVKVLLRLFALYELTDTSYSSDTRFKQFLIDNMGKISDKTVSVNAIKDIFDKHIKVEWDDTDIIRTAKYYDKDALIYLKEYLYDETLNILPHKVDVEHIMPQKGTKRHKELFMEEAGIINQEEYRSYLNRIGNKILLEAEINRSVSAEPFASKLFKPSIGSDTEDKGYYYETSNYPIAKKLVADYKVRKESGATVRWKKEDIEKATKEASEKIVRFIFDK